MTVLLKRHEIRRAATDLSDDGIGDTFVSVEAVSRNRYECPMDGARRADLLNARAVGYVQSDPNCRPYFSFASFSDPDGNAWLLQER